MVKKLFMKFNFSDLAELLRIRQWYKNLLIFLPAIFARELLQYLPQLILGFFSLCLISSANYIINDIFDREKDKHHSEKSKRTIASGKISTGTAIAAAGILFIISISVGYYINKIFLLALLGLFTLSFIYTIFLKNEIFLDILIISINFVIRTLAGFFVIDTPFSPWLILCPFFLAMFLAVGKRDAEIRFLGGKAEKHRKNLRLYSRELMDSFLIISTTLLITAYTFFSILSSYKNLVFTLPIVIYAIMRYYHLIMSSSIIARKPEMSFLDVRITASIVLWLISVVWIVFGG